MKKNSDLNFDINLLPVISLLAVLICILLLTAVWVQVNSLNVQQAVGGQSDQQNNKIPESLWITVRDDRTIEIQTKEIAGLDKSMTRVALASQSGTFDWASFSSFVSQVKGQAPDLRTALLFPERTTSYADLIGFIDELKRQKIIDVGVSPL